MFGYALRFKLKQSLIGIAALSLLAPVASHADVTKGRWIFDGFSRSTADGRGSTCVSSGGDSHAFDANNCNSAASESQQATAAANEAKRAAAAKAAAEKAKRLSEKPLPGGQTTPNVRRADGIKLFDGFGRTCIRDGSPLSATSSCTDEPAQQAAAPAPAPRKAPQPAAPVEAIAPGSLLGSSDRGAYVYEVPGSTIRDGYGRSCIKDGRWNVGTATEDCAPDLFSAYRAKMKPVETAVTQAAPAPQPTQARSAAPDPNGPVQPDAGPGVSPGADRAATGAAASVIDNSLPSFPVTTYAPELAVAGAAGAVALADDDEDFSDLRFEEPEDDDTPIFAADDDAIPDADAAAIADEDEDAEETAALDSDEDGDDDSRPAVAADMLRDDESLELAEAGSLVDDDDDDDDGVAAADEDDDDVPMMADADMPSDETAALVDEDDEDVAEEDSDDAPLFAADDDGIPEVAALAATDDDEEAPDFSFDEDDDEPVALAADDADDGIPNGSVMGLMDDDEEDTVATTDDEDDDEPAMLAADETADDGIPDGAAVALMDDDEEDTVAADDDEDDDEPAMLAADESAAEGIPDGAALALMDDDEEDTVAAADDEDDEPVAAAEPEPEAPMVAAVEEDVPAPVFAEPEDEPVVVAESIPEPEVMALVDEPDEPVSADTADIDETVTPADMLSDADRTLPSEPVAIAAAPEPAPAPVAKAAAAPQTAAEFPVTKYEIEKEPVVVAQAEEPKKPAEPAKAAPADPNVECPPTTIQVEGARFDFDRAHLRPDITASLDTIAERLRAQKCEAIHIVGHTDRIGTVKYNQRLSEKRAAAAKAYLVKKHSIDPERITTAGRSELEPVTQAADCKGKRKKALIKCYAPDRRVVVTATTQKPAK